MFVERLRIALIVLALTLAVSACGHGPATGIPCDALTPIRPTSADLERMSDRLITSILIHNETGRRVCGWKA